MNPFLRYFLSFLTISLAYTSCQQDKLKKIERALNEEETEIFYVQKKDTTLREGLYVVINSQGDTIEKSNYVAGKLEGQRVIYYPSGQVKIVENYINNEYHGPYQSFFENGSPKQFGTFKNGQFEGELKTYYEQPSGRLKESVFLTEGIENGPFKQYFEDGTIQAEGFYENGLKSGAFKEYHPNGNILAEGVYKEDFEDGEIKVYDTTGTLNKIYIFENKKPIETINVREK